MSGYGRLGHNKLKGKRDEEADDTKGKANATDDDETLLDFEFLHAAFPQRIDAGRSWHKRGQGKLVQAKGQVSTPTSDLGGDFSHISYAHSWFPFDYIFMQSRFLAHLLKSIKLKINREKRQS
jgi:DNA polymerase lambda